jgi:hypothetical protein
VYYYSVIRFRGRTGIEHELRGSSALQEPPTVGEVVPITYDPANPSNAWITGTSAPWLIPWFVLLLGIAVVAAGFVLRTGY